MSKRLKELQQKRGEAIKQARGFVDAADAEKRSMTDEQRSKYDAAMDDAQQLKKDVESEERLIEQERELAGQSAPDGDSTERGKGKGTEEEQRMAAFNLVLTGGISSLNEDQRALLVPTEAQMRALSYDIDPQGGYLSPPEQFVAQLLKNVDDAVYIRQKATVQPLVGAHSLGVPTLDSDISDADWTVELATGDEDSDLSFGKRKMVPHPVAKRIKVSNTLLRNSVLSAEQIVRERMAYKFGITQEKAFMTGDGVEKPLGLFVDSSNGISNSRDVSTGNTATEMTADGLINALYSTKGQYHKSGEWIFHRDGVREIVKLKDGNGQYIWSMGLKGQAPDTLLNRPITMSEYVPNTFTAGLYLGVFGDFSKYWIADNLVMTIQRLVELYAETNQTGFIGRLETDGAPVLEEAFARVTLASS